HRARREWIKSDIGESCKDPAWVSIRTFRFAASILLTRDLRLTEAQVSRILKATAAQEQWSDSFFPLVRIIMAVERFVRNEGLSLEIADLVRRFKESLPSKGIYNRYETRLDAILRRGVKTRFELGQFASDETLKEA